MASQLECRFFHRLSSLDDTSRESNCKNVKFKRAFQFLQLLLIQRVYGSYLSASSPLLSPIKHSKRPQGIKNHHHHRHQQQKHEVFLGGSCNPTTWRRDHAIPYFQSRSVSFYNPQVAEWSPELVEIEHWAKEIAPLLFFVIDYDTRALVAIVEVCYLAARGRRIIVVVSPMPEKERTKFIVQKNSSVETLDDQNDYENACEARQLLRLLLQSIRVPVFDNVQLALECAASALEQTKQTVSQHSIFLEDSEDENNDGDVLTQLPMSPSSDCQKGQGSPVMLIRSLSSKTPCRNIDDLREHMHRSEMKSSSSPGDLHRQNSSPPESTGLQFQATSARAKLQKSSSATESDNDDGYSSMSLSNGTLSLSTMSLSSETFEAINDPPREEGSLQLRSPTLSASSINRLLSTFCSYIPFVGPTKPAETATSQSLFVLFTLPFRFIKNTLLSPTSSSPPALPLPSNEDSVEDSSLCSSVCSLHSSFNSNYLFDLYIASGDYDECWVNTFAVPELEEYQISFTKRQSCFDNDQHDVLCDMHVRKQSRVLFYLINNQERLSSLLAELAFVVGERKHEIFVYLQMNIDEDCANILSTWERRDLDRSRKYLEDLARKEGIHLSHSREQIWQEVLASLRPDD